MILVPDRMVEEAAEDDVARLVLADWLEERGCVIEPIRLRIKSEDMRRTHTWKRCTWIWERRSAISTFVHPSMLAFAQDVMPFLPANGGILSKNVNIHLSTIFAKMDTLEHSGFVKHKYEHHGHYKTTIWEPHLTPVNVEKRAQIKKGTI